MEFVLHVLEEVFPEGRRGGDQDHAARSSSWNRECGVFTMEIAETKVTQVMDFARKHQHPLQCVMEKK